jgi:hypothetical protein
MILSVSFELCSLRDLENIAKDHQLYLDGDSREVKIIL